MKSFLQILKNLKSFIKRYNSEDDFYENLKLEDYDDNNKKNMNEVLHVYKDFIENKENIKPMTESKIIEEEAIGNDNQKYKLQDKCIKEIGANKYKEIYTYIKSNLNNTKFNTIIKYLTDKYGSSIKEYIFNIEQILFLENKF